jgi:MFS family permease
MVSGAIGFGAGPAVGGIIMDMASWHWAFFINVPIGIVAILFALRALPDDHDAVDAKLDLAGSASLFLAVIAGVYILEMFSREGQTLICAVMAVVMVVSLVFFIYSEKRAKNPTLNLTMFRDWKFDSLSLCYLLMNICYMGVAYLLPFYLTKELDISYTFIGMLILLPSVITMIISIPAGKYADTRGRRGMAITSCVALIIMTIGYWLIRPDMGWYPFIPIGILGGIMWGLCGPSVASRIIDRAREEDKAIASTMSNFLYYAGGSIGSALFASLATIGSGSSGIPLDLIAPEDFLVGFTFAMIPAIALAVATLMTALVKEEKIGSA